MLLQTLPVVQQSDSVSITHLRRCRGTDIVAAATSSSVVKIYGRTNDTLAPLYTLSIPDGVLTDLGFSNEADPSQLLTCSEDGALTGWDLRSGMHTAQWAPAAEDYCLREPLAMCDQRVAVGTEAGTLCILDQRKLSAVAEFEDIHAASVTQVSLLVAFHPRHRDFFFSASDDGMLAVFDFGKGIHEDDSFVAGQNWDAIAKLGFFGKDQGCLWCLSAQHGVALWDWKSATDETSEAGATFYYQQSDIRPQLSTSEAAEVTHCVDCYSVDGEIGLVCGDETGNAGVFSVLQGQNNGGFQFMHSLKGGHSDSICSFLAWDAQTWLTGGEDSKICLWKEPPPEELLASRTGSSLVITHQKRPQRLKPY